MGAVGSGAEGNGDSDGGIKQKHASKSDIWHTLIRPTKFLHTSQSVNIQIYSIK